MKFVGFERAIEFHCPTIQSSLFWQERLVEGSNNTPHAMEFEHLNGFVLSEDKALLSLQDTGLLDGGLELLGEIKVTFHFVR